MKILIDVNLSPSWAQVFQQEGWSAAHWTDVGPPDAPDSSLMSWARKHDSIVFTNDLDFGTLLALTGASGPSVIQVRGFRLAPRDLGDLVVRVLRQNEDALRHGALVILQESSTRVRILPLRQKTSH